MVDHDRRILAYYRFKEEGSKDSTVVIPISQSPIDGLKLQLPQLGHWKLQFNSDWEGYDAEFDNHFASDVTPQQTHNDENLPVDISLGSYNALIYSLN